MRKVSVREGITRAAIGAAGLGLTVVALAISHLDDNDTMPLPRSVQEVNAAYKNTAVTIGQGVLKKLGGHNVRSYTTPDIIVNGGFDVSIVTTENGRLKGVAGCLIHALMKKDANGELNPKTTYSVSIGCNPGDKSHRGPIQFDKTLFIISDEFGNGWNGAGEVVLPETGQTVRPGSNSINSDPALDARFYSSAGLKLAQSALKLPLYTQQR